MDRFDSHLGEVALTNGFLKGKKLLVDPSITRPTKAIVKEALFSILASEIEGRVFLDLFAGSGQIGFQALSLGAKRVIFFESCPRAFRRIEKFGLEHSLNCSVFHKDALQGLLWLQERGEPVDIAFIDPPYDFWSAESVDGLLKMLEATGVQRAILEMGSRNQWLRSLLKGKKKLPKEGVFLENWCLKKVHHYGESTLLSCYRTRT